MAVRAPGTRDHRHHHLALEAGIVVGDQLPIEVREGEFERRVGVLRRGVGEEIIRLGQALGLSHIRAIGGQDRRTPAIRLRVGSAMRLDMLLNFQRSIGLWRDDNHARAATVKMTEHPFAVQIAAAVGASVAVNAQDRSRHVRAVLFHHEAERLFALGRWRLERNDPGTRDRGRLHMGRGGLHMPGGFEPIFAGRPAPLGGERATQPAVIQRGADGGEIMFDIQHQLPVLEGGAGGAVIGFEAVVENAFQGWALPLDVEPEWDVGSVAREHGVPTPIHRRRPGRFRGDGAAAGG